MTDKPPRNEDFERRKDELLRDLDRRAEEITAALSERGTDLSPRVEFMKTVLMDWNEVPPDSPAWKAAGCLLSSFSSAASYDNAERQRIARLNILSEPLGELATAAVDASYGDEHATYRMEKAAVELLRRLRVFEPFDTGRLEEQLAIK
ncbi:MAG: hypothetical protein QOJ13_3408 [Gaiellales bacterium]|jgi:hypothetical protein|nr:hypothetical protein [Gaiellales bacterium]